MIKIIASVKGLQINIKKKLLLTSLIFLSIATANAQKFTPLTVGGGIGDFVLGADKENFGKNIKYVDSFYWQGIIDYYYTNSSEISIEIAGVKFPSIILTFDNSNKLKKIELYKNYSKNLFESPKEKANEDFKIIKTFLSKQAGRKGKKKKKFYNLVTKGYEWTNGKILTWIYLNSNEFIEDKSKQQYDIALIWKYEDSTKIEPYKFPIE